MLNVVVLVSGGGTNLQAIIDAIESGTITNTKITGVISNNKKAYALERARNHGIENLCISPKDYETRAVFNEKFMEAVDGMNPDLIVLAGFLVVIPPKMIEKYRNRIINIHHSFLPAFVGAKPYHAAFERGVKIIGATSHYVTTELDAGPIIEQDVVRITHKDTVEDLVNKGKDLEKIVLSRAVQKHIERKVLAYKNKTVIFS